MKTFTPSLSPATRALGLALVNTDPTQATVALAAGADPNIELGFGQGDPFAPGGVRLCPLGWVARMAVLKGIGDARRSAWHDLFAALLAAGADPAKQPLGNEVISDVVGFVLLFRNQPMLDRLAAVQPQLPPERLAEYVERVHADGQPWPQGEAWIRAVIAQGQCACLDRDTNRAVSHLPAPPRL